MRIVQRIKKTINYKEMSSEEYDRILPEIYKYNRSRFFALSLITLFFLLAMVITALIVDVAKPNLYIYLGVFNLILLNFLFAGRFTENNPKLLSVNISIFMSALFILGILIGTVTNRDAHTTTFLVFLVVVPMVFASKPIKNRCLIILFDILFMVMSVLLKNKAIIPVDIINGIIYGAMSIIVSTYTLNVVLENFVIKEELTALAEMDQLTCLRNRNSYERQ